MEKNKKEGLLGPSGKRYSYKEEINERRIISNHSNENDMSGKFKTAKNSTPQSFGGPVRLPYIASGGSPHSKASEGNSFSKTGTHQYSASQSSNYAIGVGKTSSSSNLKATVSGGNFTLTGGITQDKRDRIEYK